MLVSSFIFQKMHRMNTFLKKETFLDTGNMTKSEVRPQISRESSVLCSKQEGRSDPSWLFLLVCESTSVFVCTYGTTTHTRTHTQLRLKTRSGEMNHLMPADGVMEGGEERSGGAEIRTTRPNAHWLLLRRWFHFASCSLRCARFMPDFIFTKTFSDGVEFSIVSSMCSLFLHLFVVIIFCVDPTPEFWSKDEIFCYISFPFIY